MSAAATIPFGRLLWAECRKATGTWAALGLSRLLPIALMLTMTSEWSQRTALTTFTLEPRRGRVLAAKLTAGMAVTAVGGCLASGIAQAGLAVAAAAGRHPGDGWSGPELAGIAVSCCSPAASAAIWIALPLAIGTIHHPYPPSRRHLSGRRRWPPGWRRVGVARPRWRADAGADLNGREHGRRGARDSGSETLIN
jgi:hypothetical protein